MRLHTITRSVTERLFLVIVLVIESFLAIPAVAWCQGSFGGVTGRVVDSSGATVPEATVVLTNLDTGTSKTGATTTSGIYSITGVAPGQYRISVTSTGFKAFTQEPIIIGTAIVVTLDINLTLGEVTETVNVNAEEAALQTTSAEIGTSMSPQFVRDLPITLGAASGVGATGRRQIENFAFLTPGVTGNQFIKEINGVLGQTQEMIIEGQGMSQIGASAAIAEASPPFEAIAEFRVQNTLYSVEYGGGAHGVENFTIKSGTTKFHGSLFEFVRNDKFDARGFFPRIKNYLRQNEFGGTIGGPLNIPKVYDQKDRTFFFAAYSGFRLRGGTPSPGLINLPTPRERNGDFSDYPFPIFDPVCGDHRCTSTETRQQFSYNGVLNVIPPGRISEVAKRAVALLPPLDFPEAGWQRNYVDRSNQPANDTGFTLKIDHRINDKQQLSVAYWSAGGNIFVHGPIPGAFDSANRNQNLGGGGLRGNHTYTISNTLMNHIGFGHSWSTRGKWKLDPRQGNEVLQIPGIPLDAPGYPQLMFSSLYPQMGNANSTNFDAFHTNWSWTDDLIWVTSRHQLKVGGLYRLRRFLAHDLENLAGSLFFSSASTTQLNDPVNSAKWGNSFASFLLGEVFFANRLIAGPELHFSDHLWGAYAEDSIKLTPKLTFTAGLRYEIPRYLEESNGNISFFSPTAPNAAAGGRPGALAFLGDGPGRTGYKNITGSYHKSFMPRVSLAYQFKENTVVRLGYGIFRINQNFGMLSIVGNFGNGYSYTQSATTLDNGVHPAFGLDTGFPATNITLPNLDPTQRNNNSIAYVNPRSNDPALLQSWTFDIQRSLPFNVLLDAAYVGNRVTGTWAGLENLNQVNSSYLSLGNELIANSACLAAGSCPKAIAAGVRVPYAGFVGTVAQALRPFPQFTSISNMFQRTGYNTYHSLQVRAQKRYSNGLSFLGAYTLSKNIGVQGADAFFGTFGGVVRDTYNRKAEKSVLPIDRTHVFVLSWSYDLPFGRGKRFAANVNRSLNYLIGGWQFNGIHRYQSGVPISIFGGPSLPIFGGGNRPNWVSGRGRSAVKMSNFDPAKDVYLDINNFSQPSPFTFGTAPPYMPSLRPPFYFDESLSVFKRFPLGSESTYLEFRAEAFNVFNRVAFAGPGANANLNNPASFGRITSVANTPRIIQFALKVIF
ncbi:MAG: TonB-dependent receptor [Acidobacteriota bacterium]